MLEKHDDVHKFAIGDVVYHYPRRRFARVMGFEFSQNLFILQWREGGKTLESRTEARRILSVYEDCVYDPAGRKIAYLPKAALQFLL